MSRFLDEFEAFIRLKEYNVLRIAEIKDGKEPEARAINPSNPCQNSYSVAKAFTATAIGLLYDQGKLDVDDKITEILKDELPEGMDPRWHNATVDDILRHKCGLPGSFLDIDVFDPREFGKDYLKYMLTYPLECAPGTTGNYTDGAYYMLSRIVEKVSGMPLDTFLWEYLLYDLEFTELAWSHCPMGHPMGATGLYIKTINMVKLGEVYRTGGTYHGKRLLSEKWVDLMLSKPYAFSYHDERRSFSKGGMRGQNLLVIPSQNRVVAWHSFNKVNGDKLKNWIYDYGEKE